jgi:oxygen-independent coproporphyrinogen III oxidase
VTARHLYVHVPFCARRCVYCDFSIAVRRVTPVDEYLRALTQELDQRASAIGELDTIYLGGGTPSRLGGEGIVRVLDLIRKAVAVDAGAEITIEANPDDVTAPLATQWKSAGVNRISLGVQSFDDTTLKWMHRVHDSASAQNAFNTLRDAGFENISVDLIFALPDSLSRSWESDLDRAIELNPDHISLYGLTIESATPLGRWSAAGSVFAADEEKYAAEFLLADRAAVAAGFEHYEVSNFAKPGKNSRHNSAYWTGAQYVGLGPSAHSFDGNARSWNVAPYAEWVARLARDESTVEDAEVLTESNRQAEKVYLGLRTRGGLSVTDTDRESANLWSENGWAEIDGDVVRLTSEGWLRLDSLAAALTGF